MKALPELPPGFTQWIERGTRWFPGRTCTYIVSDPTWKKCYLFIDSFPKGADFNYFEAV